MIAGITLRAPLKRVSTKKIINDAEEDGRSESGSTTPPPPAMRLPPPLVTSEPPTATRDLRAVNHRRSSTTVLRSGSGGLHPIDTLYGVGIEKRIRIAASCFDQNHSNLFSITLCDDNLGENNPNADSYFGWNWEL
ncbi:hypothetical protein R6Q59_030083 [Mikania micrantha]